jgi:hypothetical protein
MGGIAELPPHPSVIIAHQRRRQRAVVGGTLIRSEFPFGYFLRATVYNC